MYIEKIILPKNLKVIGSKAFAHCTGIKEMTIPSTIEDVGLEVFSMWKSTQTLNIQLSQSEASKIFTDYVLKYCWATINYLPE